MEPFAGTVIQIDSLESDSISIYNDFAVACFSGAYMRTLSWILKMHESGKATHLPSTLKGFLRTIDKLCTFYSKVHPARVAKILSDSNNNDDDDDNHASLLELDVTYRYKGDEQIDSLYHLERWLGTDFSQNLARMIRAKAAHTIKSDLMFSSRSALDHFLSEILPLKGKVNPELILTKLMDNGFLRPKQQQQQQQEEEESASESNNTAAPGAASASRNSAKDEKKIEYNLSKIKNVCESIRECVFSFYRKHASYYDMQEWLTAVLDEIDSHLHNCITKCEEIRGKNVFKIPHESSLRSMVEGIVSKNRLRFDFPPRPVVPIPSTTAAHPVAATAAKTMRRHHQRTAIIRPPRRRLAMRRKVMHPVRILPHFTKTYAASDECILRVGWEEGATMMKQDRTKVHANKMRYRGKKKKKPHINARLMHNKSAIKELYLINKGKRRNRRDNKFLRAQIQWLLV